MFDAGRMPPHSLSMRGAPDKKHGAYYHISPAPPSPDRPSHLELGLQAFPALCVMKFTKRFARIALNMLLQRVLPLSCVLPFALQW
jgi:hypothetical protein